MRVKIFVQPVDALKAGFDEHGPLVAVIKAADFTPEEREVLSRYPSKGQECDFDLSKVESDHKPTAPDLPNLQAYLAGIITRQVKLAAEEEARRQKGKEKHEASVQEWLEKPLEEYLKKNGDSNRWYARSPSQYGGYDPPVDDRLAPRIAEANAEAEVRNQPIEAEKRAKAEAKANAEAEAKAKKVAGQQRLQGWAKENGSPLLKARITDGFSWESLAYEEYVDHIVKSLGEDYVARQVTKEDWPAEGRSIEDRNNPTLPEIELLRRCPPTDSRPETRGDC